MITTNVECKIFNIHCVLDNKSKILCLWPIIQNLLICKAHAHWQKALFPQKAIMQAQSTITFISEYIYIKLELGNRRQLAAGWQGAEGEGNIKIRPWQSSPIFVLSLDIDTSLAPYLGLYIIKMRCCMLWRQKGRFINKSFYTMSKIRSSSSSSSRAQLCSGYESYDSQILKRPPSNGYF